MLDLVRLSEALGRVDEARACLDRYLRAHGIRIDDDITTVNVTLGRSDGKSQEERREKFARLLQAMSPADATQLVMLLSRLDSPSEPAPSSDRWATGLSPLAESAPREILPAQYRADTESADTESPDTETEDSGASTPAPPGDSEDET